MKAILQEFVQGLWTPGEGNYFRGLTVFPIYPAPRWNARRAEPLGYVTLHTALDNKSATVSEMRSAHVPELLVKNAGSTCVLAIDGDELVGGKQNRILNSSVLLGRGETAIPVSCVEQHRWRETRSSQFSYGERLPHSIRSNASHVRYAGGGHSSDQRAIWQDIQTGHGRHGSHTGTGAMHEIYRTQADVLKSYEQALPYPRNAVGLFLGIGGKVVSCDVFDAAATAEHYWDRMVRAAAADAVTQTHQRSAPPPPLSTIENAELASIASPGLGTDVRLKGRGYQGSALIHNRSVIHLNILFQEACHAS